MKKLIFKKFMIVIVLTTTSVAVAKYEATTSESGDAVAGDPLLVESDFGCVQNANGTAFYGVQVKTAALALEGLMTCPVTITQDSGSVIMEYDCATGNQGFIDEPSCEFLERPYLVVACTSFSGNIIISGGITPEGSPEAFTCSVTQNNIGPITNTWSYKVDPITCPCNPPLLSEGKKIK